jgi:hypothetical protein
MKRLFFSAFSAIFVVLPAAARSNSGAAGTQPGPCTTKNARHFATDASGNVSMTGKSYEGPACLDVFFNPLQMDLWFETATTVSAGPDLSKVVLTGSVSGAVASSAKISATHDKNLLGEIARMEKVEDDLHQALVAMKSNYVSRSQAQERVLAQISDLRKASLSLSGDPLVEKVKTGFRALEKDLRGAINQTADYAPSDRTTDPNAMSLMMRAQELEDDILRLLFEYSDGSEKTFDCAPAVSKPGVSWTNWYAQCKDPFYTPFKAVIDADLQTAKDYALGSDNDKTFGQKAAIVKYWSDLFAKLGMKQGMLADALDKLDIKPAFFKHVTVECGILFNQNSSTAINLYTLDLGPTLTGADPAQKAQSAFATVTCASPFVITGGIGISTIEQKQFAIIQGSDGKGGTQNAFGTTNDNKISPLALAVIHGRVWDSRDHRVSVLASLGIAGNLSSATAASPIQFLPGISIGFFRTIYVTAGPIIGNHPTLIGGYKEGDPVPTAITAITGLIANSYTVRMGFAVTFGKP